MSFQLRDQHSCGETNTGAFSATSQNIYRSQGSSWRNDEMACLIDDEDIEF